MEIVAVIVIVLIVPWIIGSVGNQQPLSEEEQERRRKFNTQMAIMDHYDVGPFKKDGPGK